MNSEKLALLVALGIFLCIIWTNLAFAQLSSTKPSVEITSHATGQEVPVGELTISGTSADNITTDCQVEVDWNNQKPYQKTLANGPGGVNDYSNWTFTYTNNYYLITNGLNELTARLSCTDNSIPMAWDTVGLIGTPQNHPPVADAGPDFTVNEKVVILLNAAKGSDPDPMDTLMYKWTQIGGSPFVISSNNNTATPIFNAPLDIPADTTFTLQFSVIDNHGLIGTDTLNVLVKNIPPPPELEEEEEDAAADEEEEEEDAAADEEEEEDAGFTGLTEDAGFGADEDDEYEQLYSYYATKASSSSICVY